MINKFLCETISLRVNPISIIDTRNKTAFHSGAEPCLHEGLEDNLGVVLLFDLGFDHLAGLQLHDLPGHVVMSAWLTSS